MNASVCVMVAVIGVVFAAQTSIIQAAGENHDLNRVQGKIQLVGEDLKNLSAEKAAQIEQLKKLEIQYGELANSLNAIKTDIKQKEESLRALQARIATTRKDIQVQRKELAVLIKSAYAIGDQQGLKLILSQRDPALSGRIMIYQSFFSKARLQKIQTIQESTDALVQLETLQDTESRLLQRNLETKQQESLNLLGLKNRREKLLAQLESDFASKNQQLQKLMLDKKKLETLVASLHKTDDNVADEGIPTENSSHRPPAKPPLEPESSVKTPAKVKKEIPAAMDFAEMQGQLPWPVQGRIMEHFGGRQYETAMDGAVISASEGADIRAIAPGRVVYADWLLGYGLMIIVNHGKGFLSLYAYNQSLQKSVGEQVRAGETLASVGRSGGRAQAALYFGIRKNGRPVDPEQWCGKAGK